MKLLIITLEYPPQTGGIASYVVNFADHLLPNEVMVYAPSIPGAQSSDDRRIWKTVRLKPYAWFIWPHWVRLLWQVNRICRQERITMIHVHQVLPVGYVAWLIQKWRGIPYTVFLHGTDVTLATKNSFKRRLLTTVLRGAERVVANSQFLANKLKNKINVTTALEILYPSPADYFFQTEPADKLSKLRSQLALNGKKVIITVARLAEGKGYPHLIHILPKLLEKIPNLIWIVVGDGPKKTEFMGLISKNSLQNIVRFMGSLPSEELPVYYQLADAFVLLTHPDEQAEEGFGTVFLEAAASGLPVVAGRAGGVEEAVEHLVTGLVVDVNQETMPIGAITELLTNQDYAKKLGLAGKQRAEERFTWQKQLEIFWGFTE